GTLFSDKMCQGYRMVRCFKNCHYFSLRFIFTTFITRLLIKEAQPLIAISKTIRDTFQSYYGNISIKVLYYGIDLQKFRPTRFDSAISDYNSKNSNKIILFFGRLIKERGISKFLLYFTELIKKIKCRLIIIGLGPDLIEIKSIIQEQSIQNYVQLMGVLRNQNLIDMINRAHVVILPILFPEPFGLIILEAMSCEKPIISFDLGGAKELIDDRKTGILIPPYNWTQFIEAICTLLQDDKLRNSLGKAARIKVEQNFSWDKFIDHFLRELS
ncbi:MAG: glycosyltransferase family 4 protein, partial [Candidatus Helarchaeota archaeon]